MIPRWINSTVLNWQLTWTACASFRRNAVAALLLLVPIQPPFHLGDHQTSAPDPREFCFPFWLLLNRAFPHFLQLLPASQNLYLPFSTSIYYPYPHPHPKIKDLVWGFRVWDSAWVVSTVLLCCGLDLCLWIDLRIKLKTFFSIECKMLRRCRLFDYPNCFPRKINPWICQSSETPCKCIPRK